MHFPSRSFSHINLHHARLSPAFLNPFIDSGYKDTMNILQGVSLVAQWLRTCLPMQETRVQALVREDPTCRGATKPVRHNY